MSLTMQVQTDGCFPSFECQERFSRRRGPDIGFAKWVFTNRTRREDSLRSISPIDILLICQKMQLVGLRLFVDASAYQCVLSAGL